jgi:hypothetical protein
MIKVYALGVMKLLDYEGTGQLYFSDTRLWSLYENFEEAEHAVINNYGDIYERFYNYACIEEHYLVSKSYANFSADMLMHKQWWYKATFYTKIIDSDHGSWAETDVKVAKMDGPPHGYENVVNIWVV